MNLLSRRLRRGTALGATVLATALALTACSSSDEEGAATQKLRIYVGPSGTTSSIYLADAKGWFKEEGLSVEFVQSKQGAGLALKSVQNGQAEIAAGTFADVVLARAQGGAVTAFMLRYGESPVALASLKKNFELKTPQDLVGRTGGIPENTTISTLLPVLLRANGIDPSRTKKISVDYTLFVQSLLRGQVDYISAAVNDSWCVSSKKAGGPDALSVLRFAENKVDLYDSVWIASDDFLSKDPTAARSFAKVIAKAEDYVQQHPDEAADAVVKAAPELEKDVVRCQVDGTNKINKTGYFAQHGFGAFDPEKATKDVATIVQAYDVKGAPEAGSVYTNDYLPGSGK